MKDEGEAVCLPFILPPSAFILSLPPSFFVARLHARYNPRSDLNTLAARSRDSHRRTLNNGDRPQTRGLGPRPYRRAFGRRRARAARLQLAEGLKRPPAIPRSRLR